MVYEKILVPFDGSNQALKAFRNALEIAKRFDSTLYVVSVLSKANAGAWYKDKKTNQNVMRKAKNYAKSFLVKLEDQAKKADVQTNLMVKEGDSAVKTLLSFAKSKKIDLIVMGSTGKGRFDRVLLGSVSNGVVQKSNIPVLVVK